MKTRTLAFPFVTHAKCVHTLKKSSFKHIANMKSGKKHCSEFIKETHL